VGNISLSAFESFERRRRALRNSKIVSTMMRIKNPKAISYSPTHPSRPAGVFNDNDNSRARINEKTSASGSV